MTNKIAKPLAWLLLAIIVFVTVSPIGLRPHTIETPDIDRAMAYLAVGLAFALAYPKQWKTVAALLIFGALAIECLQYFSPTRHPRFHDAAVKALGVSVGLIAGWIVNKRRGTRPETDSSVEFVRH
jgi:peptidoglycan/LPS O-acetylase OafA/YrhL